MSELAESPQLRAAGVGLQFGAQIGGAFASRRAANFQAEVARQNARAEVQGAAAEEVRLRREQRRRIGATRAAFGAAGVTLAGTPLEVLAEQALVAEEDALLVQFGGRVAAREQRSRASIFAAEGRQEFRGGLFQAGATLLGGFESGALSFGQRRTREPSVTIGPI